VLVTLALLAPDAHAQSAPIRRTRLQDGREFVAEVLGTEATGLRVRVPAGEMLVSFEDLLEVKPIDASAYAAQSSWRVIVAAPEDLAPAVEGMFNAMPGVIARPVGTPDPSFSQAQIDAMVACGSDVGCLRGVVKDLPWQWIVAVEASDGGGQVTSQVSTADRTLPAVTPMAVVDAPTLWTALHASIGLSAPTSPPPSVPGFQAKPPKPRPTGPAVASDASAFVPIPGWTSFQSGDSGRGAVAVVGTIGFTALSAGAGYALSTDTYGGGLPSGQAAVFGVVGFLGSSWAFNHWFGKGGGTAVVPTGTGGAVAGSF
jgi:hypothetical protein